MNKKIQTSKEEDYPNETKSLRFQEQPTSSRTCNIYKREEIKGVKYWSNIIFLGTRKLLESYAKVAQMRSLSNNNQSDKYSAIIEKLVQINPGPVGWGYRMSCIWRQTVMLERGKMQSLPSLPSLPNPLLQEW